MSDNFWADGVDEVEETNAMRVLREKAEADSKVIREMAERLAKMEAKEQRSALEDSLKAKGLDPKVAEDITACWAMTTRSRSSSGATSPAIQLVKSSLLS